MNTDMFFFFGIMNISITNLQHFACAHADGVTIIRIGSRIAVPVSNSGPVSFYDIVN